MTSPGLDFLICIIESAILLVSFQTPSVKLPTASCQAGSGCTCQSKWPGLLVPNFLQLEVSASQGPDWLVTYAIRCPVIPDLDLGQPEIAQLPCVADDKHELERWVEGADPRGGILRVLKGQQERTVSTHIPTAHPETGKQQGPLGWWKPGAGQCGRPGHLCYLVQEGDLGLTHQDCTSQHAKDPVPRHTAHGPTLICQPAGAEKAAGLILINLIGLEKHGGGGEKCWGEGWAEAPPRPMHTTPRTQPWCCLINPADTAI